MAWIKFNWKPAAWRSPHIGAECLDEFEHVWAVSRALEGWYISKDRVALDAPGQFYQSKADCKRAVERMIIANGG